MLEAMRPPNTQVYYHLGEFQESVFFALRAGKLFDIEASDKSEYVETIIGSVDDLF